LYLPHVIFNLGRQLLKDINNQKTISLWEIQAKLRIKILCATLVNVKELGKVSYQYIFHKCPIKSDIKLLVIELHHKVCAAKLVIQFFM
jgi:hypothetical protein